MQVPPDSTEGTACIRLGDVYSLVVDTYATQGEWAHALDILRDMHERDISTEHFISGQILRNIYQQNGMDAPTSAAAGGRGGARQGAFGVDTAAGMPLLVQQPLSTVFKHDDGLNKVMRNCSVVQKVLQGSSMHCPKHVWQSEETNMKVGVQVEYWSTGGSFQ